MWLCRCDCGAKTVVSASELRLGRSKSCGCLARELRRNRLLVHGHAGSFNKNSETYKSWSSMLSRCQNPNFTFFSDYGGRGISVCDRWQSFKNFLEDMGERPEGMTIGRKDNDGPYCKDNCRWENRVDQANNKRNNVKITFNGETLGVCQWSRKTGISKGVISYRYRHGWPVEAIFHAPSPKQ